MQRSCEKARVLTLYGTEIWHYKRKRGRPDLFTRAYQEASYVTFYSERLMSRAFELGLAAETRQVIYPPVGEEFPGTMKSSKRTKRRRWASATGICC